MKRKIEITANMYLGTWHFSKPVARINSQLSIQSHTQSYTLAREQKKRQVASFENNSPVIHTKFCVDSSLIWFSVCHQFILLILRRMHSFIMAIESVCCETVRDRSSYNPFLVPSESDCHVFIDCIVLYWVWLWLWRSGFCPNKPEQIFNKWISGRNCRRNVIVRKHTIHSQLSAKCIPSWSCASNTLCDCTSELYASTMRLLLMLPFFRNSLTFCFILFICSVHYHSYCWLLCFFLLAFWLISVC